MAMKPFVDAEEIRKRLGMMENPIVLEAINTAIIGTQIYFEELMQTRLMKQSNTNLFTIDSKLIYVIPDGFHRLRLVNSHVREDVPLVVTWADDYKTMMTMGGTLMDFSLGTYFVNRQKGVVHIDKAFDTKVIKVTYDSGYDGAKDAPEWIKEAITSYVPVLLNQQQIFNRAEQQKGVFDTGKEHAFTLMAPYLRDVGFCFRAMGL